MEHHVAWKGAIPRFGTTLGIDFVLCRGKLIQKIEALNTGNACHGIGEYVIMIKE